MDSLQIEKASRKDRICNDIFVGVFAADTISEKEYSGAFIVNTDTSNESGQHWVAFYCEEFGKLEGFDSFGKYPGVYSKYIKDWIGDDFHILNSSILQSQNSTLCGNYCLYYILLRCHGFSYEDTISIFCGDCKTRDLFICRFINKYFKLNPKFETLISFFKLCYKNDVFLFTE
jgi:hypothetical protein